MSNLTFLLVIWNLLLTAGLIVIGLKTDNNKNSKKGGIKGGFNYKFRINALEDKINHWIDVCCENSSKIDELEKSTLEKFCENYICGED